MGTVTLRHELACTPETYFEKCVFSEEFNRRMHCDVLKFPGFKVIEQKTDGAIWTRRVQIDPPTTGVPGPLKKVIGDKLSYIEEGEYDPKERVYRFKVIPSTMPDKTKIKGEMRCEPSKTGGDKACLRVATIDVEVKVFMLGSIAEEKILSDIKVSYEAGGSFVNEFVKEKGY